MPESKKPKNKGTTKKQWTRCWGEGDDPRMTNYHDKEWGKPIHDDKKMFEFLVLEGMQAGLSWRTILYKRENFRVTCFRHPERPR